MSDVMRFGVLGSNNVFVRETTMELSDFCQIDAIILRKKTDKNNIILNDRINLTSINSRSFFSLLKLPFEIKKTRRFVDVFLVHYMNLYFALLILFGIINRPIVYFCYGTDVHNTKIANLLLKRAIEKVDLIFVQVPAQKEYIHNLFGVSYDKVESSKVVFPVNPSFKKYNDSQKQEIRKKWKIFKKYVIFSPRTVNKHYNHHILLEAINLLDDNLKTEIQIVITGFGDKDYLNRLIEIGKKNNLDVVNLNKFLTPQEMAEIYNISLINVNIPNHDQFGRSIVEGCLCDCVPLLNIEIPAYHDLLKDNENCIYVKPEPEAIAAKIEWILKNQENFINFYVRNAKLFLEYQNTKQVYNELTATIEKIVLQKRVLE
ncbi:glycosyltransferase family 4 protein [Methanosarcina mazei]|uniref:Glycosyl transferase family 1 domain-containing protein n=2 Tax=Methanosarcina mazei TaxID=2209 RepID=A0A0E3PXY5_METMZ|nr:glycosyltransferase family 4 protein [Methanosarcina mazei]AKB41520.1 hypothetical protein MSMAW_2529 [Methanosarcina mazei WWM610]KKH59795.1 hypothetical protein DU74_18155 [Methanosarcina mazei]